MENIYSLINSLERQEFASETPILIMDFNYSTVNEDALERILGSYER